MLRIFHHRRFLGIDAGIVVVVTLLFTAWFFVFDGSSHIYSTIGDNRSNIYRTIATISASLLGFSITFTSIVLGLSSDNIRRLSIVQQSKHYPALWKVFFQMIKFLGGLTLTALVCLIWDNDSETVSWVVILLVLFIGLSGVRMFRAIWILERLIKIIVTPPRKVE